MENTIFKRFIIYTDYENTYKQGSKLLQN